MPTVSLVGLSLFENAAEAASQHWGIAAGYVKLHVEKLKLITKMLIIWYRAITTHLFTFLLQDHNNADNVFANIGQRANPISDIPQRSWSSCRLVRIIQTVSGK